MKVRRVVIEIEAPWTINLDAVLKLIQEALNNAGIQHQAQIVASVKSNHDSLPPLEMNA